MHASDVFIYPYRYDVRKISGFFDPLPPCLRWETGLHYKIHATSLTLSAFPLPPSPLSADVINGWPLGVFDPP